MKKIAVYGGTFDIVHIGHIEIIKRLSERFDEVIVIPTTIRYYKKNTQMFSFNERFEMIKERTSVFKNVVVSDVERNVSDEWRFIDTLKAIVEDENEYYVAIGSDSFQQFTTWENWETIVRLAKLIVFRRPGYEDNFPPVRCEYISDIDINMSSTKMREKLRETLEQDFDEMIDDMIFTKGFEDELEKEKRRIGM